MRKRIYKHGQKKAIGTIDLDEDAEHINGKLFEFSGFMGPSEQEFEGAMRWANTKVKVDLSNEINYQAYLTRFFDSMAERLLSQNVEFERVSVMRKIDLDVLRKEETGLQAGQ